MKVRTRFAPSPTGMLHIGGFRTALFAWAFARKNSGSFILRIEDTDQERKVDGAVALILDGFKWLGLDIDEGPSVEELKSIGEENSSYPDLGGEFAPYIQSLRKDKYKKAAQVLLEKGFAYKSTLGGDDLAKAIESGDAYKEEVDESKPYAIRLKLPKEFTISTKDAVRGNINWTNPPLKDPVILKSDGLPTYHLAVVVDDNEMEISHVIRGEEWIPTTPIHLYLYDCFGYERPVFCHLSPILGSDGKKLSKRDGAASITDFRNEEYLPEALINFISLIGWSPGDDQEIFTLSEFINKFSLSGLSVSGGMFDRKKLDWMNGEYINKMEITKFVEKVEEVVEIDVEKIKLFETDLKERIKKFSEVKPLLAFITDFKEHDFSMLEKKKISNSESVTIINKIMEVLESVEDFTAQKIETLVKPTAEELDIKIGTLFITLRVSATGSMTSLPLFKCLEGLGKKEVLSRMGLAKSKLN